MSLDIGSLSIVPDLLDQGRTTTNINYTGLVDATSDNPVSLTFYIEPAAPAFIIVNGQRQKSVSFTNRWTTGSASYSKRIIVEIAGIPGRPTACSIRLEAVDSKGNRSARNSFFIYT